MTIDECIEALQNIKNRHPGQNEVVIGVRSCEGGKIESLSLQAKSRDGENEIVFEEKFEDSRPETRLAEKIKRVLRRYYESDPWTEEPNKEFDDAYTAQEALDAIVDILK